jgi:hypothetical protein
MYKVIFQNPFQAFQHSQSICVYFASVFQNPVFSLFVNHCLSVRMFCQSSI